MRSPNTLLANPTWNGEFHQVKWRWVCSWTRGAGDSFHKGFLKILFRKPARGRQIDMSAVKGTIAICGEQGHFRGMKCSEVDGQWSWEIEVDWYDERGEWDSSVFLYTGVATDDRGHPFIGCEILEANGGPGEEVLHVVGKRDSARLTRDEEQILGVEMTGSEYKQYANEKYGKKHRYVDSDYGDSSENDNEETETDSGSHD
jgi:hypothetical protein